MAVTTVPGVAERGAGAPPRTGPGGQATRTVSLDDRYEATEGTVLLSGMEAVVRLLLTQRRLDRLRHLSTALFVSGYEGSPLGGLDQQLQRAHDLLAGAGIVFSPGLNEELAATAVGGTQLVGELDGRRVDGVVGFWYGKNPGLDRAADAIRHANMSGTPPLGGAVALVGDDPLCKSSTLPSSCELTARALGVPVLTPASVADVLTLGLHAVALSRHTGLWSAMKIVADIADASATITLPALGELGIPLPDQTRPWHPRTLLGPGALEVEEDLFSRAHPPGARLRRAGRPQPHHQRAQPSPARRPRLGDGVRRHAACPERPRAWRGGSGRTSVCVWSRSTCPGRSARRPCAPWPTGCTRCWSSRTRPRSSKNSSRPPCTANPGNR